MTFRRSVILGILSGTIFAVGVLALTFTPARADSWRRIANPCTGTPAAMAASGSRLYVACSEQSDFILVSNQ